MEFQSERSDWHGWVVLDRSIPSNVPSINADLLFLCCRDVKTYSEKREKWRPPAYRFAPNYIRDLAPLESTAAAVEFEALQLRWPEFEREIQRVCRDADDRVEAARVEEERAKKQAAADKKKQAAAARA